MAYSGSTAASSVANPPVQLVAPFGQPPNSTGLSTAPTASPGGQGGGLWKYVSTNATTDFTALGFFTDGLVLGMKPGDIVFTGSFTSAGSSVQMGIGMVVTVSSTGASLSTGSVITSTFN